MYAKLDESMYSGHDFGLILKNLFFFSEKLVT